MIVANVFHRLYQAQGNVLQQSQPVHECMNSLGLKYEPSDMESAPLAVLFPNTSFVFADIAASAREPQQVFILLENIYRALDKIAQRLAIFKVETVGDCYVGAAGLPDPMNNHGVVACEFARWIHGLAICSRAPTSIHIAGEHRWCTTTCHFQGGRVGDCYVGAAELPDPMNNHGVVACEFAREALKKMKDTTHQMEVSLGPDTTALDFKDWNSQFPSLMLNVSDRSGQVTAGVLRVGRIRFQFFAIERTQHPAWRADFTLAADSCISTWWCQMHGALWNEVEMIGKNGTVLEECTPIIQL